MAKQKAYAIKEITASGGTLRADENESLRIVDLMAYGGSGAGFVYLNVGGTVVHSFRTYGKGGSLIPPLSAYGGTYFDNDVGIFRDSRRHGFALDVPVASGETVTVTWDTNAATSVVLILEVWDAADVKASEVNGSLSTVRRFIHEGTNLAAITQAAGAVNLSLAPSGVPSWPFDGSGVPEKHEYRIAGILGCPCEEGDGTNTEGRTDRVLLYHRETVLFDEDRVGIPFASGTNVVTDGVRYSMTRSLIGPASGTFAVPPLWFPEPLIFKEGDTLTTVVGCVTGTDFDLRAQAIYLAYIMERKRLG
jgi:hypothetical protein